MFTEIKGRGEELEKVVAAAEQCLEGPVNEAFIQEFVVQHDMAQQQVEVARAKIESFKEKLPKSE